MHDPSWRKSSYSVSSSACVEVAFLRGGAVLVRDSKNPTGAVLTYDHRAWSSFIEDIKADALQRPRS